MTKQELDSIISYSAGMCLCGHGEICSVCDRDHRTRTFEILAKRAAKELLAQVSPEPTRQLSETHSPKEVTNE